jgi:hypothetical protein
MSDSVAEPLSPIDAATLWPQLRRLSTEVVAQRSGENILLSSGLAATGLVNLPKVPRTIVVGLKRGLTYRGVLVVRELDGRAAWEAVSLRLVRDKDDAAVAALLAAAAAEIAARGSRSLFLRTPEGSPHAEALRHSGMHAYRIERLFALPRAAARPHDAATLFRPARAQDRAGIFRLYCRAVPEHIRRNEAPTQQDWRAVLDSFDCDRQFVLEAERGIVAWVGFAEREARVLLDWSVEGLADAALDFIEAQAPRNGALVLSEDQPALERRAQERGYTPLGVRLLCVRRLAALNPLKEVAAAPVESVAVPQ